MERQRFFSGAQEESESVEKFVTDLKLLASTCNFGTLQDSLVRDRIIGGIRNSTLREELLKTPNLDLDKCLPVCRANKLSKEQTKAIEAADAINAVEGKWDQTGKGKPLRQKRNQTNPNKKNQRPRKYDYCGTKHEKKKCPAYGKECSACHKLNHLASVCRSKQMGSKVHTPITAKFRR